MDDRVPDIEVLYRRVPGSREYFASAPGECRLSSSAFNDRFQKPSVDLASKRAAPHETKLVESDGVVSLLTADVRSIATVRNEGAAPEEPAVYYIDVVARPILPGNEEGQLPNHAHAQIEALPDLKTSSRFKKLNEALAQLASGRGWLIERCAFA